MSVTYYRYPISLLLATVSSTALAHSVHVSGNAFMSGLGHPVLGLDHLLAMVAVGLVSTVMGSRAIWQVPLAFVVAMVAGGLLGGYNIELPGVEIGITASVIALGAVLAIGRTVSFPLTLTFVALFGVMHGHAHGAEMPELAEPFLYGLGFISGTIGLHLLGVSLGLLSTHIPRGAELLRVAGLAGFGVGVYLFGHLFA
ncbi:MAG: HupE/UreJ family protein [Candidatus Thiodiazotropha sp.]